MEHKNHKMYNMGEMRNTGVEPSMPESKKEKHYPSVHISSKQMPELKGKKFGDNIELHIQGEVGGMHEDYNDKKEAEFEIKIIECGIMENDEKHSDTLKEKMSKRKFA